jgi:uncharacterized membrane protein
MIEELIKELLGLNIPHELIVIIVATLPVAELRGALPLAINQFHLPWYKAFYLAVIGNLLPVPVLLLFLEPIARAISHVEVGRRFICWAFEHARRHSKTIEKYERLGLTLFVAIPLPMTGAWTGSIAAFLLGMKFRPSFISILSGVIIAGVIVTILCLLGWIGAIITGVGLCAIFVLGWWKKSNKGGFDSRSDIEV